VLGFFISFAHLVTVTFDDDKSGFKVFKKKLAEEGYPPQGEPRYIK